MRVLQLISTSGLYGAESVVISLMKELAALECPGALATLRNPAPGSGDLARHARQLGFEVFEVECSGRFDWRTVVRLRAIAGGGFGVIHSHGYKANLYSRLAIRGAGALRVATAHNWPTRSLKMRAYAALDKFALRSFDRVATVSDAVYRELRRSGVPLEKLVLIENGIDTAAFRGGEDTARIVPGLRGGAVIGYVGRLAAEKGLDVLLRAMRTVVERVPDAQLIMAGDGPERATLEALTHSQGLDANVHFLGVRRDMPKLYRVMDVLVLPSRDEGMPMTILEALAAGTAVVATAVGQIPRVIRDRETGLLVPADSDRRLADAIVELLKSAPLRTMLAAQGRRLVEEQFTVRLMAQKYIDLYERAAAGRGCPVTTEALAAGGAPAVADSQGLGVSPRGEEGRT